MASYSLEATKTALVETTLDKTKLKLILSSKGLQGAQLEESATEILDAQAKRKNEKATEDLTKDTLNYKFVVEGLKDSIRNTWKSLTTFLGSPLGLVTAGATAIGILITSLYAYSKADEKALEKSKENLDEVVNEYENVTSEVKSLKNEVSSLQSEIDGLDPITDANKIKDLETEKALIEQEVALLEKKQQLLADEADKSAQEVLTTKTTSKYGRNEEINDMPYVFTDGSTTIDMSWMKGLNENINGEKTTEYEELARAMEKVNELEAEKLELEAKRN